ncbi:hypothetical protein [Streptomyces sp. NPDC058268]|uniref:ABC transporter ATP-binding protein n=1 Tax=Streptomyces sp. NPDC058268 TaxID=3346413 RepID=UPI0036E9C5F4
MRGLASTGGRPRGGLAVVRYVADTDTDTVMRAERLVETGTVDEVIGAPRHPCTRALLDAVPRPAATR